MDAKGYFVNEDYSSYDEVDEKTLPRKDKKAAIKEAPAKKVQPPAKKVFDNKADAKKQGTLSFFTKK